VQNERVELNILYYVIIRVDFNDERGRGVVHEYDTCPLHDENINNTPTRTNARMHACTRARTHTHTHKHTEEYIGGKIFAVAYSGRVQEATKWIENQV